jgi:hypothetical protein
MTFHASKGNAEFWFLLPALILDIPRPSIGVYWLVWGFEVRW